MATIEQPKTLEKFGLTLTGQLLKVVDEGIGPLSGARDYADSRLRLMSDPEKAIKRVVRETVAASGTTGFVTGLGGFITLPVSVPASITGQAVLNARMVAAIAHLRGWDLQDEVVRNAVLIAVAGGYPNAVLSGFGVKLGQKAFEGFIKKVPIEVIRAINKKAGVMLLAKYGTQRSMLTLSKGVPLAGGVIGGVVDAGFARGVASLAKKSFPAISGVPATQA